MYYNIVWPTYSISGGLQGKGTYAVMSVCLGLCIIFTYLLTFPFRCKTKVISAFKADCSKCNEIRFMSLCPADL